jgi:hypothetical protein
MRQFLLCTALLCSCSLPASQTVEVKVELVAIPAAKSIASQAAKRAVTERPIVTHVMQAELGADGRVRTHCAPGLPDLRRWPERPGLEQPK